jgi:hypothetical protein
MAEPARHIFDAASKLGSLGNLRRYTGQWAALAAYDAVEEGVPGRLVWTERPWDSPPDHIVLGLSVWHDSANGCPSSDAPPQQIERGRGVYHVTTSLNYLY